jgi:glutathione S-transferase
LAPWRFITTNGFSCFRTAPKIPAIVDRDGASGTPVTVFESGAVLPRAAKRFIGMDTSGYPHLERWLAELEARPAFQRALALTPPKAQ